MEAIKKSKGVLDGVSVTAATAALGELLDGSDSEADAMVNVVVIVLFCTFSKARAMDVPRRNRPRTDRFFILCENKSRREGRRKESGLLSFGGDLRAISIK